MGQGQNDDRGLVKKTERDELVAKVGSLSLAAEISRKDNEFMNLFTDLCPEYFGIGEKQISKLTDKQICDLGDLLAERTRNLALLQRSCLAVGVSLGILSVLSSFAGLVINSPGLALGPLGICVASVLCLIVPGGEGRSRKYHMARSFLMKHRRQSYFPLKALKNYSKEYTW